MRIESPYGRGPEFVHPSPARTRLVGPDVFRLPPRPVPTAHIARHERGLIGPGAPAPAPTAMITSGTWLGRLLARLACRWRIGHCWHRTPQAWYGSIAGRTYCCECPSTSEWVPPSDCGICVGPDDSTRHR